MNSEKSKGMVSAVEHGQVGRALLRFFNSCPSKPVIRIDYENLANDDLGMCLSAIQGAYITRRYILGGYEARYQFKLIYRNSPSNNDERLSADEVLDEIGTWAAENFRALDLGEGRVARSLRQDAISALFAKYDDGTQDNQILMTLVYEVN